MRRFGKWVLTLGIIASFQANGLAGPFDGLFQSKQGGQSSAPTTSAASTKSVNQQAAESVARNLKAERLTTKNVRIAYADGVVTLTGQILNTEQKARAHRAAMSSAGVQSVNNLLEVIQKQTAQSPFASKAPTRSTIQQAGFERPNGGPIRQTAGETQALPEFAETPGAADNQAVAEGIAKALGGANLNGYDIEISYQDGVASLKGRVGSQAQWAAAGQAASGVSGVQRVDNQLRFAGAQPQVGQPQPGAPQRQMTQEQQLAAQQQFVAYQRYIAAQRFAAQQAAMRSYQGQPGAGVPPGQPGPPPGAGVPPAQPAGGLIPGQGAPAPPQSYGHPGAGGNPMTYNQPNLPDYAWPSYAKYPNSAQISYPKQYSASAFPYIGPFYPYPQVPLGWRKAQLEWDDGYWKLNFSPRTDRWWWFMSPKNW